MPTPGSEPALHCSPSKTSPQRSSAAALGLAARAVKRTASRLASQASRAGSGQLWIIVSVIGGVDGLRDLEGRHGGAPSSLALALTVGPSTRAVRARVPAGAADRRQAPTRSAAGAATAPRLTPRPAAERGSDGGGGSGGSTALDAGACSPVATPTGGACPPECTAGCAAGRLRDRVRRRERLLHGPDPLPTGLRVRGHVQRARTPAALITIRVPRRLCVHRQLHGLQLVQHPRRPRARAVRATRSARAPVPARPPRSRAAAAPAAPPARHRGEPTLACNQSCDCKGC